jgi:HAD superfamily hydrolase (TIGR01509 family)
MSAPPAALPWAEIDTVLLDMDGTLLDLHFDNHFWLRHVPQAIASREGISPEAALAELRERYRQVQGSLKWYCVDHWSNELGLPIAELKEEVSHFIRVHPHALEFLAAARKARKRLILVTNAHLASLALKLRRTALGTYLDDIVVSHDLGVPKEVPGFWARLHALVPFDPAHTLLVDDSLPVLRSARSYGVAHLLAVARPDSQQAPRDTEEFTAIHDLAEMLPVV